MANFTDILDRPASEAERPPAVPTGDYICVISGLPKKGKSTRNQTDFIEYPYKIIYPVDGTFDEDDMKEYESVNGSINGKEGNKTFYITDKSAYRHKEFLQDDLGLEIAEMSHWEAAQQANGSQFIGHFVKKPTDDGKGWYSDMTSTAKAE